MSHGKDPRDDQQQKGHHETSTRRQRQEEKTRKLLNFPQFDLKPRIKTYLQAEVVREEHLVVTEQSSEPQHAAPEWGTSWFSTGSSLEADAGRDAPAAPSPVLDSGADRRCFRDKDKATPCYSWPGPSDSPVVCSSINSGSWHHPSDLQCVNCSP